MSRTVSETLLDAISNQQGETILRVKTWADLAAYNAAPNTPERTWLTNKFKIEATEAEAALITDNDYTLSDFTVFIIERGATLAGVEYVVQSGIYFVSSFTETDGRLKITGSSFPDQKIIIDGDDTYENVITAFCTEIGKTATFKDTGAAWLSYQFLPAGKQVILNKAERFLNLLRQKYLILCYERGPKELVFYHAATEQSAWKDITFVNGEIIIVASSGNHHVAKSTNGLAYNKYTAPMFVNAITHSASLNLFVAVGIDFGMYSSDGVTWTQSGFIQTNPWLDVIWSDIADKFIAIAENARATSSDGDTWTTGFSGVGAKTIAESSNEIVILGTTNCLRSTDGTIYTSNALSGSYNKVIFENGLFVAVGVSACVTSPDGITWTARTIPAGTYTGLAYSPTLDLFVAMGDNLLATSPDGVTWTSRTAPADQAWVAVAWADALSAFFAVSSDGDNRIASSVDGINWQILTTQADYSFSYLDGPASSIQHGTNTVHFIWRKEDASTGSSGDTSFPAWNLGYLESTDSAPGTNSDPFYKFFLQKAPLRLDVTDGDRIHFEPSWVLDPTKAIDAMIQIVEAFDSTKSPAWYQEIRSLALFDSVEGGSLPSTIERVAAYTPLVSSGFDGNLTPSVNNLQALAEAVDDLNIAGGSTDIAALIHAATEDTSPLPDDEFGIWESVSGLLRKVKWSSIITTLGATFVRHSASTAANDFLVGSGTGAWIKKTFAETITILRSSLDSAYAALTHSHAASDITSGTMSTARLGSGTASATTALHGDQTYKTIREVLTADRTYYVRTDGSDSNTGLANTSGGAFLTIQKAIDVVSSLDLSIYDVTIQLGDGTYTAAGVISTPFVGNGAVTIQGNSGTPANVVISLTAPGNAVGCITAENNAIVTVKDLKVTTTTNGHGLYSNRDGKITFSNIDFGACGTAHIRSQDGGKVTSDGNYAITGAATRHWFTTTGIFRIQGITITITGTPAFSSAFADATSAGVIVCNGITFSGSATGARYSATANGVINTVGGGATYLAGNAAGATATGGQYL